MTEELPVHISRRELHSVECPPGFETDGSFEVRLVNHGNPLHVHLHLDDTLSEVASLDASNHYVEAESQRSISVAVDTGRIDESLFGKLKVVSAYGTETRWIDVELVEPEVTEESVQVDASLAKPQPIEEPEEQTVEESTVFVLALAAIALLIAAIVGAVLQEMVVLAGSVVVLAGVVIALRLYFPG